MAAAIYLGRRNTYSDGRQIFSSRPMRVEKPYQYLASLKIEFSVEKEFLNSNNLNQDSIKLFRLTDKWSILPTEKLSEDNNKVYYKATSTGTSYYAIAATEAQPITTPVAPPATGQVTEPPLIPKKSPSRSFIWIIIVLLVILIIAYLVMKKKRKQ